MIVIAQDAADPQARAFERAARGALGPEAVLSIEQRPTDPPDADSVALAHGADGVVELSWSDDRARARIHCYLSQRQRWVDREVTFGESGASPEREAAERGRLLGLAVATMFADDENLPEPSAATVSSTEPPPVPADATRAPSNMRTRQDVATPGHSSLEFAGIASAGIDGTAAGLGASAALRIDWLAPFSARMFLAARAGNIPEAQASTRTAQFGGGLSADFLPRLSRWHAGARVDGFLSYFEASHLSADDVVPDRRSRWLPGSDLLLECGFRFADAAGLYAATGLELMFGTTQIFTHGRQVAVVPALRAVGEFGFRTRF